MCVCVGSVTGHRFVMLFNFAIILMGRENWLLYIVFLMTCDC